MKYDFLELWLLRLEYVDDMLMIWRNDMGRHMMKLKSRNRLYAFGNRIANVVYVSKLKWGRRSSNCILHQFKRTTSSIINSLDNIFLYIVYQQQRLKFELELHRMCTILNETSIIVQYHTLPIICKLKWWHNHTNWMVKC